MQPDVGRHGADTRSREGDVREELRDLKTLALKAGRMRPEAKQC